MKERQTLTLFLPHIPIWSIHRADGWFLGKLEDGTEGLAPGNYFLPIDEALHGNGSGASPKHKRSESEILRAQNQAAAERLAKSSKAKRKAHIRAVR